MCIFRYDKFAVIAMSYPASSFGSSLIFFGLPGLFFFGVVCWVCGGGGMSSGLGGGGSSLGIMLMGMGMPFCGGAGCCPSRLV